MRRLTAAVTLSVLISTAACGSEADRIVELRVLSSDPAVIAQTEHLLLSRFEMFDIASPLPVPSSSDGAVLSFALPNEHPAEETIEFLVESTGLVTLALADSPDGDPVVTSDDIARIEFGSGSFGEGMFTFELTPEAGERMLQTSTNNIGKRMIVQVDDTVLMEATIRGAFARRFQVSAGNIENTDAFYAVVVHGPLPAPVELISWRHGPE